CLLEVKVEILEKLLLRCWQHYLYADDLSPVGLKFLAITAANLHEFFMVRVGGLIGLARAGAGGRDPSGRTPAEQLAAIRARVAEMNDDQYALFADLSATLAESGIRRLLPGELDERGERVIERLFENEILGVASPLAFGSVDEPLEPTPRLKPGRLHIAVRLSAASDPDGGSAERFAVVPIETPAERFVTVPAGGRYAYVLLEDVVRARLGRFFGDDIVVEAKAFRAAFNADMAVREDAASDLLEAMRDVLSARNDSYCVRLEIESGASPELLGFLRDRLEVDPDDVAEVDGPIDLSSFFAVAEAGGFDQLRYPAWPPQDAPAVDPGGSIFESIASEDVLLIHPYESFDPVVRLV
ncbi:MAG: RNA degradosome polyphosphate kinase, partial [Planctomycetota bacterium]